MKKNPMTEADVRIFILGICDSIFKEVNTMTTGNLAHRKPCLLHDINTLKHNIFILIRDNTKLPKSLCRFKKESTDGK